MTKLKKGEVYKIKYKDIKGNITTRVVKVTFYNKSSDRVTVYCLLRDAKRVLLKNGIIKIKRIKQVDSETEIKRLKKVLDSRFPCNYILTTSITDKLTLLHVRLQDESYTVESKDTAKAVDKMIDSVKMYEGILNTKELEMKLIDEIRRVEKLRDDEILTEYGTAMLKMQNMDADAEITDDDKVIIILQEVIHRLMERIEK